MLKLSSRLDTLHGYQIWFLSGIFFGKSVCVDFKNLNRALEKDNYPISSMEKLLQTVSGSEVFSLLDDFVGYNQLLVLEEDRLKTNL
jgi:hypothetical protein